MRTIIATLSALNAAAGVGLAVLYIAETNRPIVALVLSGALLIQSGFTLALMQGTFGSHQDNALHVQLAGSTLAIIVGSVGLVTGFLANINPTNTDPEYGPMTIALLIAAHGVASLLAFTPRRPAQANPSLP